MMRVISDREGAAVPVFDLTYPQGALAPEARAKLLDELTTAILRAERAPNNDFFRGVTWGYVHELPSELVVAAGRPVEKPTFKVDLTTPQGALSDRRREEFVVEATRLVREAAGIPEEEALRVFVMMHEVAEGSWGAAGQVVRFQELREIARGEREKPGEAVAAQA
jgi:phenylpyruvate tautomerase PptA (4-oxalocrotonate tautomerase family)